MAGCEEIPRLLESFVDTFVDYTVSGFFLLPDVQTEKATRYPAPSRLIAIGDLHGDLPKARQSFRLASLIDSQDRWIGGSSTVVQIGDVLDRGSDELRILYFLEKLRRDAARSGGRIISINGNHEIMNLEGDFSYVTRGGLDEFERWARWYSLGIRIKSLCSSNNNNQESESESLFRGIPCSFKGVKHEFSSGFRARIAALRPSGPISRRFLGRNATAVVVGDSVFVHGGLLAEHVWHGLERINEDVREWIVSGSGGCRSPAQCRGRKGVVWLRSFSRNKVDCATLEHVLGTIPGAKRMVMGHTIQPHGINAVCHDRAIRIDVGMSRGCIDGIPEVLEIVDSHVRILTANPLYIDHNTDAHTPLTTKPVQVQVQA